MPIENFMPMPTLQSINGHICSLYPNNSAFAENGMPCWQVSNGSFIASATQINYYTNDEITKILIAGGVLVLALLVATYAVWKWWHQRFLRWRRNEAIREKMENGTVTDDDLRELEMPIPGVSKTMLFGAGLLVMIAGVAMWLMP